MRHKEGNMENLIDGAFFEGGLGEQDYELNTRPEKKSDYSEKSVFEDGSMVGELNQK